MRVLLCGAKSVGVAVAELVRRHPRCDLAAVATVPDDWQADLVSWAREHSIPVVTDNVNEHMRWLSSEVAPELVLSVQYRWLLRGRLLSAPALGAYNLHFGDLPRYGGIGPIAMAMLNAERSVGVTLHEMVESFDEGPIVAQTSVPVEPGATARSVFDAASTAGARLVARELDSILDGDAEVKAQDPDDRLYYPRGSIDYQADSLVRWTAPAQEVVRRVAAFTFPPLQLPRTRVLTRDGIVEVSLGDCEEQADRAPPGGVPGLILDRAPGGGLRVQTGDRGIVRVGSLNGAAADAFPQLSRLI